MITPHDFMNCEDDENRENTGLKSVSKRLFEARTILINGGINYDTARRVNGQLLAMAAESDADIRLFVNSHGGHVECGDTIHDMIAFVAPRVLIIGTGWVASAGAHIYLSVPVADRYCLPNTRFLLHQPAGGSSGTASDIEIDAEEIVKMRERLNKIIAQKTGQKVRKVEQDTDRNFWMSAEEAKAYGVVGSIISSVNEL